jgi:uncharacterized protein with GYD domain
MTSGLLTQGEYDVVGTFDAPDEETASAFVLAIGRAGNSRTTTLRAFDPEAVQRIIAKIPS